MGPIPTDAQLEDIARFIARATLEVERSLREPEQLLAYMTPQAWQRWQQTRLPGSFTGGGVSRADVGVTRIQRLDTGRAIANLVTRTDAERWGALTLQLEAVGGRWRATGLQRLYAARHYQTGTRRPVVEPSPQQRLNAARTDRREAAAALRAVQRRLDELPKGSSGRRATTQLSTTWEKIVADLDREIATLTRRLEHGRQAQRVLRRTR